MSFWDLFNKLFSGSGKEKKIEEKEPYKIVGIRNGIDGANVLQYWRGDTGGIVFGTAAEYSSEYSYKKGYNALGSKPILDVSYVPTFGFKPGKIAGYDYPDYYSKRGYTANKGFIWDEHHKLKFIGVERAMELWRKQSGK